MHYCAPRGTKPLPSEYTSRHLISSMGPDDAAFSPLRFKTGTSGTKLQRGTVGRDRRARKVGVPGARVIVLTWGFWVANELGARVDRPKSRRVLPRTRSRGHTSFLHSHSPLPSLGGYYYIVQA